MSIFFRFSIAFAIVGSILLLGLIAWYSAAWAIGVLGVLCIIAALFCFYFGVTVGD